MLRGVENSLVSLMYNERLGDQVNVALSKHYFMEMTEIIMKKYNHLLYFSCNEINCMPLGYKTLYILSLSGTTMLKGA